MYAQESIDLLRKSGIQFEKHERDGMDPFDFAAELIGAGVVLQPNIFLSFHRCVLDFCYCVFIIFFMIELKFQKCQLTAILIQNNLLEMWCISREGYFRVKSLG